MNQRTVNTILAALALWELALRQKEACPDQDPQILIPEGIADIAEDGNRLPLSITEIGALAEGINESGLRLMTDDRDTAQPLFSLIDQGFSVRFAAHGPTKELEIVIEEEKGLTHMEVYTRKHRADAVLALLNRAMHMSRTT